MATPAISLVDVSKLYRRYGGRQFATLKSALLSGDLVKQLRPEETFRALTNVSFDVARGQTLGVIGRNGSGKSTALKLVAGITKPTSGIVTVQGRISALIELGEIDDLVEALLDVAFRHSQHHAVDEHVFAA